MTEDRKGVAFGAAAYGMWGLLSLFWPLLRPAGAFEILAHRIAWTPPLLACVVVTTGGFRRIRGLRRDRLALLAVAAVLVGFNWGLYVWSINNGHVLDAALGYFLNPLVSMLLGAALLGERLRPLQKVAAGIVATAVVLLSVAQGDRSTAAVAVPLAVTFGLYGYVKKRAGVPAVDGLAVETGLLFAPAVAFLFLLEATGRGTFDHGPVGHDLLLASSGAVTAIPLLCFAAAANRVPLTILGLLQYVAPTITFVCGIVVRHEPMPASRWMGFGVLWTGLAVFAVEGVVAGRLDNSIKVGIAKLPIEPSR